MTALFQNASQTSESILSHPFTSSTEVKQDGNNADPSRSNRTCDAKSTKDEDASSILLPTLRRLSIPKSPPNLFASTSRFELEFEGEPVRARLKPTQAEMPSGKLDGFDVMLATSNRHSQQDSAGTGIIDNETKETRLKEEDPDSLQTASDEDEACQKTLKLSPSQLIKLASTPASVPRGPLSPTSSPSAGPNSSQAVRGRESQSELSSGVKRRTNAVIEKSGTETRSRNGIVMPSTNMNNSKHRSLSSGTKSVDHTLKSKITSHEASTPGSISPNAARKATDSSFNSVFTRPAHVRDQLDLGPPPLCILKDEIDTKSPIEDSCPSPMPTSIPLPPFSLPTHLHLELSSHKPSPLYIYRSKTSEIPYELSRVKIERLLNFLVLPPQLEQVLLFGTLACLDAFLYSYTILPLRFFKALSILVRFLGHNVAKESQFITTFVVSGAVRMWKRKRRDSLSSNTGDIFKNESLHNLKDRSVPTASPFSSSIDIKTRKPNHAHPEPTSVQGKTNEETRLKFQSMPSTLSPEQKADLLKGLLLILSCTILMYFDASRMYHGIRGQAAIKLYVIYNVLEVCDRLFAALGQDVLECLFAKDTLEPRPNGRSKIWRPVWLFVLALIYNLIHATSLFYQVITLNVAVNSYSNALLTLLMSNQFVEIKSTVFKKFEKENLFQLTCADVVERFQLWLMLTIIAFRNIIETGGFDLGLRAVSGTESALPPPLKSSSSILPKSFTVLPDWVGQVMGPFLLVLGSEMLVDWIKHAYITKFNNTKPAIYGRFLDILAKDYYSNAFADQNLVRRVGLPTIPLASLFFRASVQTYHMFIATHMPLPVPSPATALSVDSAATPPASTAAIQHFDHLFRQALGRSNFGAGSTADLSHSRLWTLDDGIAFATMLLYFFVLFLVLLTCKLLLGMFLLSYARHRYRSMKERESVSTHAEGRRAGGLGVVEVDDDKRRWIYQDDPAGRKQMKEQEADRIAKVKEKKEGVAGEGLEAVMRYSMAAKRIW